mmetsp:Transcript_28640/g.53990  ORF Transcript_28640/g.53990 Transcript_28640/m.53990 type:complete len:139 (-) Transcript_28640:467-883(-)
MMRAIGCSCIVVSRPASFSAALFWLMASRWVRRQWKTACSTLICRTRDQRQLFKPSKSIKDRPMHNDETQNEAAEDRTVYVREVMVADLPEEMQEEADGAETLFAVHATDGERLALVKDRGLAFDLARQNNFWPVTVH